MAEFGKQFHHDRVALSLLPGQFANSENLRALVSDLVGQSHGIQECEDAIWDIYTLRWLWIAEGQQLDYLGEILGEPRQDGLADEAYRTRLYAVIQTHISNGEPERIITATIFATVPTLVHLIEKYPATVYMYAHVPTEFDSFYLIERCIAAGVYFALVASVSTTPFVFGVDRDAAGTGFGSELAYGDGWGESGAGNESIGGDIAELFIGG